MSQPVAMPQEPPYRVLKKLAGNPLILIPRDEEEARRVYECVYRALVEEQETGCAKMQQAKR